MKKERQIKGMRRIYVASSWRNMLQPAVVVALRNMGHEVYDFKKDGGFNWSNIDPDWQSWSIAQYMEALNHPLAVEGFDSDFQAMEWADTFVLVLPCGRSAHLELGWAVGQGKTSVILLESMEPELMIKMCDFICPSFSELLELFEMEDDE